MDRDRLTLTLVVSVGIMIVFGMTGLAIWAFQSGNTVLLIAQAVFVLVCLIALPVSGMRIVREYERLVIFRLGKCTGAKGPGVVLVIPFFERAISVDTRERFHEVSHEACITKDNAKIDVDFLFYWKVVNPEWSQTRVQNLEASLEGLATGLLRAVIGLFLLDEALAQRERINEELKDELEDVSEHWGVTVTTVEIREIVPPQDIQDAMHRQLAAERDRRAVILEAQGQREHAVLRAEGEVWALERLYRAAKEIDAKTLQLKYLESLAELGKSNSTKYVFPLEFTQLIKPLVQAVQSDAGSADAALAQNGETMNQLAKRLQELEDLLSKLRAEPTASPQPRTQPVSETSPVAVEDLGGARAVGSPPVDKVAPQEKAA